MTRAKLPPGYPPASKLQAADAYSGRWLDEDPRLYFFLGTAPTETIAELKLRLESLNKATAAVSPDASLLMDVRFIQGNNDPEFERVAVPAMVPIASRFTRVAVLTSSVIGGLQVRRMKEMGGILLCVTTNLQHAEAYCRGDEDDLSGKHMRTAPE